MFYSFAVAVDADFFLPFLRSGTTGGTWLLVSDSDTVMTPSFNSEVPADVALVPEGEYNTLQERAP